jgi:hypothetical protein
MIDTLLEYDWVTEGGIIDTVDCMIDTVDCMIDTL